MLNNSNLIFLIMSHIISQKKEQIELRDLKQKDSKIITVDHLVEYLEFRKEFLVIDEFQILLLKKFSKLFQAKQKKAEEINKVLKLKRESKIELLELLVILIVCGIISYYSFNFCVSK